jgi:hypothetical protein
MWQLPKVPILSEIVGLGREWIKGKQEIKKAKTEAETTVIVNSAQNLADWEKVQAKNSRDSWKDEYWTIILSVPFLAAFNGDWVKHIQAGFHVLSTLPDWYQYALLMSIGASFGVRMSRIFKK